MNELYEHVMHWHAQGFATIPIQTGTKKPAVNWLQYRRKQPWRQELARWFSSGQYRAYGLLLARGLTVLDFDDLVGYLNWREWARTANVYACAVAETGYGVLTARGVHVYITQYTTAQTRAYQGFDLKVSGYVLGEGSQHPSGTTYTRLERDGYIWHVERLEDVFPPWLVAKAPPFSLPTRPSLVAPNVAMPGRSDDALTAAENAQTWGEQKRLTKLVPAWEVLGLIPIPSGPGKGIACCPLHDDKHPSLSCDFVTGRISCFAGCTGLHGWDAVDAYRWRYSVDYVTAVRALAGR